MRTELGKIQRFEIGMGGYDDAMFGLSVTLGGNGWGVQDFDGTWNREPDAFCKWTKKDQLELWGNMCDRIRKLMAQAKVSNTQEMVGVPVQVTFVGSRLESWRILEEVL